MESATIKSLSGNPLGQIADPCVIVIFGASGDLTKRKLIPALYNLARGYLLPDRFSVVGYARSDVSNEEFRKKLRASVTEFSRTGLGDQASWERFAQNLFYLRGGYEEPDGFRRLKEYLAEINRVNSSAVNRIFYLATPPDLYAPVLQQIAAAGLDRDDEFNGGWSRIVIEKPFGSDYATAQKLNRQVHDAFDEKQIYRIDHYLGKETVQNIIVFRFGNAVFEPIWNRRYVDHVQITAAESVGVEGRGGYYEGAGVIRDMFQNHLLQLLCLTAMEPPVAFTADAVRDEKVKVLRAIRPLPQTEISQIAVRGQYGEGTVGSKKMSAYREASGVASDSGTETYAALKLFIDNWRWEGVPFYLRSGKGLAKRVSEIAIHFKQPPLMMFQACPVEKLSPNVLVMRLQPDEGISLTFEVKPPGPEICVSSLSLDFNYQAAFGESPPDAYETLLLDCTRGDSTLFTRHDWVEMAWSLITPVIRAWEGTQPKNFPNYEAGSCGPKEADLFIERDGRKWRTP